MASINGYTAERMKEIEDSAIIDGEVVAGNLILTRFDTTTINAGSVIGPTGPTGTMPSVARARVTKSGLQSITDNTITSVLWDTEEYDTNTFHSTSTNTSRIVIPSGLDGVYMASYTVVFNGTASQISSAWMLKNAAGNRQAFGQAKNDATNGIGITGSASIPLSVGDYLEVMVFQNSGVALDCGGAISYFSVARIGPL